MSLNVQTELVTGVVPGWGNDYDGHRLKELVEEDEVKGIKPRVLAADKGYDDGEDHYYLEEKGIASDIELKDYRMRKKRGIRGFGFS